MRSRYGEKLTDESFLIREQFDVKCPAKPKQITKSTLHWKLYDLCRRCGIDKRNIAIAHGFRKFFTTQLIEADLKTELRWLLEGHNLKANDSHYVRISEKRLQQEYEKAIDNLTIDPANRLQRKVETLTIEKSRVDKLEEKIRRIEKMYR